MLSFLEIESFDTVVGTITEGLHPPIKMMFHTYDPHLISVDPFSRIA
jgi:hypothetical protein